jgi:hypothetical protein
VERSDYFQSIDLEEIKRFVEEGQEEHLHLEFKQAAHPSKEPKARSADKKNISKCISGFANSDGGIIIWGVSTSNGNNDEPDVAKALKPIKELKKFINLLNRLEGQAVTPIPTGVKHEAIEQGSDEGFVKTFVPISENAPHMANFADKHYYKRSGDSFYQCEHYDIRDMFSRKSSAVLTLSTKQVDNPTRFEDNLKLQMVVSLQNEGGNFARSPFLKMKVNPPFQISKNGLDGNKNIGLFDTKQSDGGSYSYGGNSAIVYPDMRHGIDIIQIRVDENDIDSLPDLIIEYLIVAENMPKVSGKHKTRFIHPS